ncbi:TniB family NTP-binding protein [Gordonia sp. VNK21]|uniref:TniB family NTP-binding protein n=1 Tax=Gordonia sp. VNK21 TaxID=3382483 RepID=UPI0038D3A7BB
MNTKARTPSATETTIYDLDGHRRAVQQHTEAPAALSVAGLKRLPADEREQWLADRDEHHGHSHVVMTNAMIEAFNDVHILTGLNWHRPDDREVYLISGPAGSGKTTIGRSIAREFERQYATKHPGYLSSGEIPVVVIATPARCSPTAFDKAILTFMHHPFPDSFTHDKLKAQVIHALRSHHVQLVIIDDLHRLKQRSALSIETSDLLKEYLDLSTASYVYMGVNLTASGFFNGDAGSQIASRGALLQLQPFTNEPGPAREEWCNVVSALESNLRLLRHRPGALTTQKMLALLYNRTRGSINALNKLLQTAAIRATTIPDTATEDLRNLGIIGKERIDLQLLRSIKSVAAVEVEQRQRQAKR